MVALHAENVIEWREQTVTSRHVKGLVFQLVPKSDDKVMFQVKCADCGCFPEECKYSPSAKECPNCSWYECCCGVAINEK